MKGFNFKINRGSYLVSIVLCISMLISWRGKDKTENPPEDYYVAASICPSCHHDESFYAMSGNGRSGLFIEGLFFRKLQSIEGSEGKIEAGKPFKLDIVSKEGFHPFAIDNENVYKIQLTDPVSGALAIHPYWNNAGVSDFRVYEQMKDPEPLRFLFESGTNGYNTFRIPAIIRTQKGTLLAFAEGRKNSSSDTGDIDLVLKRSEDNGKTWSELSIIWNDGENVCGNPAPVVDRQSGNVFLLSTWNLGSDHESEIIKETSKDTRRVFVLTSTDDGRTWSDAKEITGSTKLSNWTWYATGPCHGIQVNNGKYEARLIIPCDHIESGTNKYFSHIIYSDDQGKTWRIGGTTPQDQVNECSVAELPGGRLMLNMRNYDRTQKTRKVSISNDGGNSWSGIYSDPVLIEPICQGSLLSTEPGCEKLIFMNPADENSRKNMTLRLSTDEGRNWTSKVVFPGPSAYSDIVILATGNIGCLMEVGHIWPYQGIVYREVSFDEFN